MEPLIFIDIGDRAAARKLILEEMRAKWGKLSEQEASTIEGSDDLVKQLQAHYGVEATYARWEVENFLKGRSF